MSNTLGKYVSLIYVMYSVLCKGDICLQTLLLLFKYSKRETQVFFVSPANSCLVGILITIGDVIDIFAVLELLTN